MRLDTRESQESFLFVSALLVIGVLLNVSVRRFGYMNLDDVRLLTQPLLRPEAFSDLWRIFDLRNYLSAPELSYFPVRDLTFALDYLVFGQSSGASHLVNLAIHLSVVLMVYSVATNVFNLTRIGGFFAATLVLVCPISADAVGWIYSRKVSLLALWVLAGVSQAPRLRQADRAVWTGSLYVGLALLAGLTHPLGFVVPLLCAIVFMYAKIPARRAIVIVLLQVAVMLYPLAVFLTRAGESRIFVSEGTHPVLGKLLLIPYMFVVTLLPFEISGHVMERLVVELTWLSASVFGLCVLMLAICGRRIRKSPSAAWLFLLAAVSVLPFLITPSTNLLFTPRYAYLSGIFIAMAVVAVFEGGGIRPDELQILIWSRGRMMAVFLVVMYLSAFYTSFLRSYRHPVTFWKRVVRLDHVSLLPRLNLAKGYVLIGNIGQFQREMTEIHHDFPDCWRCYSFHAGVWLDLYSCAQAVPLLQKALEINPNHTKSRDRLERCAQTGSPSEATEPTLGE